MRKGADSSKKTLFTVLSVLSERSAELARRKDVMIEEYSGTDHQNYHIIRKTCDKDLTVNIFSIPQKKCLLTKKSPGRKSMGLSGAG